MLLAINFESRSTFYRWTISFKITAEIQVRKHMFCSQLRHQKHKNRQTKRLKTAGHINCILVGLFRIHLQLSFGHLLTFIRYIEIYFTFSFLDGVRYNEDFVKSRFCSIYFILILAGLNKIVRYTENFVIQRFVTSRFHCRGKVKSRQAEGAWFESYLVPFLSFFLLFFRSCFVVVFFRYIYFLFLSASFPFFLLLALYLCFARLCDSRISSFCLFLSFLHQRHFPNFNFFKKKFALHIIFELT